MATVGRITQGASSAFSLEERPHGRVVSLTAGDEITSIDVWVAVDTSAHNMQAAVYTVSGTTGTRVALGTLTEVAVGTDQNIQLAISYTIPTTGDYVLALQSDNQSGGAQLYYDTGAAESCYRQTASNGNGSVPPASWADLDTIATTDNLSLAATYTAAASGSSAPKALMMMGVG